MAQWRVVENEYLPDVGFVYLIERPDGLIKIGHARDIDRRFAQLSREQDGLKILKLIRCLNRMATEAALHEMFDDYREFGEWFSLPDGYNTRIDWLAGKLLCAITSVEMELGPLFEEIES